MNEDMSISQLVPLMLVTADEDRVHQSILGLLRRAWSRLRPVSPPRNVCRWCY